MNKLSIKLFVCMFFLSLSLFINQGIAQEYQGGFYGPQSDPRQAEIAREIIEQNYQNMDSTLQALAEKRNELDAVLASPNPDPTRIETLSREIGELRGKVHSARASIRSQLAKKGLSPNFLGCNSANPDHDYVRPRDYHHNRHHNRCWGYRGGCMGGCW